MEIHLYLFAYTETVSISLNEDSGHSGETDIELDHSSQRLENLQVIIGFILCAHAEPVMPRVISYADAVHELEPSS